MACKYQLFLKDSQGKNIVKKFGDVASLNDYLLLQEKYIDPEGEYFKRYGDIVFSIDPIANNYSAKIDKNYQEFSALVKNGKISLGHTNDGEEESLDGVIGKDKQRKGTSEFIRSIRTLDSEGVSHPLFPVFDKDEYWNHRRKDLARAVEIISNKEEREGHPIISKYDIPILFTKCAETDPGAMYVEELDAYYNIHNITDEQEISKIIPRTEAMWEQLAHAGTAIHNVMDIFFKHKCYKIKDDDTKIKKIIQDNLYPEDKKWLVGKNSIDDLIVAGKNLYYKIEQTFGPDPIIKPEIGLTTEAIFQDKDGNKSNVDVTGRLDLVVIGTNGSFAGRTGIIDYKCSQKAYHSDVTLFEPGYNSAKVETFSYQLGTYEKMLRRLGLNRGIIKWIVPMQMKEFQVNKGTNKVSFNGIGIQDGVYEELILSPIQQENLNELIPETTIMDDSVQEIGPVVENFIKKSFPVYAKIRFTKTDEDSVNEMIEEAGGFQKVNNEYQIFFWGKTYKAKNEALLREKICKLVKDKNKQQLTMQRTRDFKDSLRESFSRGSFDMRLHKHSKLANGDKRGSRLWLASHFSKYANNRYEIMETESQGLLDQYGIILIRNKASNTIDVLKISKTSHNLKHQELLGGDTQKRKYILGTFQSDTLSYNSADSPVLESTQGNIELMEAMAVINCLKNTFANNNMQIGEVAVCNPDTQDFLTASNKQLLYNYSRLAEYTKTPNNFAYNDSTSNGIQLQSFTSKIQTQLKDLERRSNESISYIKGLKDFCNLSYISKFDQDNLNKTSLLAALNEFRIKLEQEFPQLLKISNVGQYSEYEHPEIPLYNNVLYAISELNGLDLNQQIFDHSNWMESSFKNLLVDGLNGNLTDNPGTLKSATLNKLAQLTETAYQNCRQDVLAYQQKLNEEVIELKEDKSFGWVEKITFGNQTNLYLKFYDKNIKDDLCFVNPFDPQVTKSMSAVELKFLKNTIRDILSKRHDFAGNNYDLSTDEGLKYAIEDRADSLLVPLTRASTASQRAVGGWMHTFRDRLKRFSSWSRIKITAKDAVQGALTDDEVKSIEANEMYEMVNRFESSFNPERRREMLNEHMMQDPENPNNRIVDLSFWEHNAEALRIGNKVASSMKEHLDQVFPMLKAIVMHLNFSGIIQNDRFEQDLSYATNYIKSKVFNMPLEDIEKWGKFKTMASATMGEVSKISLAFNVKSLYQAIDGFWKDIMLVIQKPDGTQAFSKQNMKDSFFWIYKDLGHTGDKWSLGEHLNQEFGINDQDVNSLSEKISKDNAGIHNFWSLGFRFASRPDYYNRMTIFGAQMRHDKTFEAYEQDSKGNWFYNFKKDGRFQHLIKGETNHPDYQKEKSLYITMMDEFVNEQASYNDGTPVERVQVIDGAEIVPLPRAYTTRQSESMKALGDKIYGYYSHEKRSMMQSYTVGALFWQMNTFWSSKKNQYLSGRTFTQQGNYVQYEEPETDENGNIITDEKGKPKMMKYYSRQDVQGNIIPVAEKDLADGEPRLPYMVWKGRPQEGIIVTVSNLLKDAVTNDTGEYTLDTSRIAKVINPNSEYWEDMEPEQKVLYMANLRQLLYDLFMLLFVGALVSPALMDGANSYAKSTGNNTLEQAFKNNCLLTICSMFDQSTDDFNMIKSIGGRGKDWTPFAISSANRLCTNFSNVLDGNSDFYDATVKSVGAFRSNKPMLDFVKLNTFGVGLGTNMNKES